MPYPFAHPAAVLPLARPMGRLAAPSALAIGSMAPDFWYLVPLVGREASHSAAALLWFCLPVGLVVYLLFHLLLKEPLIALVSPRLAAFTPRGLPRAPWHAVVVSLLAGALTHLAWDGLTHSENQRWLQHASTLAGTAILAAWVWRRLRRAPLAARAPRLPAFARGCVLLALCGAALVAALWSADPSLHYRHLFRTAGSAALQAFVIALLVYCALFQRKMFWQKSGSEPDFP